MPRYNGGVAHGRGIQVELLTLVQDIEEKVTYPDNLSERNIRSPRLLVVVSSHRERRGDLTEPLDHLRAADVAGMDDDIGALEASDSLWSKQTVRIGDDAHEQ